MIVERVTFSIKPGKDAEAIDAQKTYREQSGRKFRIYQCRIGTLPRIAIESEFESLAEVEKSWSERRASSEFAAHLRRFAPLQEGRFVREIWEVIE